MSMLTVRNLDDAEFHTNVQNIYRITRQEFDKDGGKGRKDGNTGFLQGPRFTKNVPEIKAFVRVASGYEDIKTGNEVKSQDLLKVDSSFFSVFSSLQSLHLLGPSKLPYLYHLKLSLYLL